MVCEYAHQNEAFERYKDSDVIPLFLEQGLGKTAITLRLAAYKYSRGEIDQLLVIAPNGVHVQWHDEELPKFLPHYNCPYTSRLVGGKRGKKDTAPFTPNDGTLHVVCVNIDTFSTKDRWKDVVGWSNSGRTYIVVDEATDIKRLSSLRTQRLLYGFVNNKRECRSLAKVRSVLTGTPITEGPFDVWSIMEFVKHDYFGRNYYSFKKHYCMHMTLPITNAYGGQINVPMTKEIWERVRECENAQIAYVTYGTSRQDYEYIMGQEVWQGPYKNVEELKDRILETATVRTLRDCVDMPDRVYDKVVLDMPKEIAVAYRQMYNNLMVSLKVDDITHISSAQTKLAVYIRLQQITSGFIKVTDTVIDGVDVDDMDVGVEEVQWLVSNDRNPKVRALLDDVQKNTAYGPVIVATKFTCEAAMLYDELVKQGYRVCLVTGWRNEGSIEVFKEGGYDVMVANARCIRRGYNFQVSHCTLIYSNTPSLDTRLQLESRTDRLGQKESCVYKDYAYMDTVDVDIIDRMMNKKQLLDYLRD